MKNVFIILVILLLIRPEIVNAQIFDIVIKGGHVIDPKK